MDFEKKIDLEKEVELFDQGEINAELERQDRIR
jgi:hypothetical protein